MSPEGPGGMWKTTTGCGVVHDEASPAMTVSADVRISPRAGIPIKYLPPLTQMIPDELLVGLSLRR